MTVDINAFVATGIEDCDGNLGQEHLQPLRASGLDEPL
jgi:hypothetical protein